MTEEKAKPDWFPVFTSTEIHKFHIAQALLEKENIGSVILNKQDSAYVNFNQSNPIHLLVQSDEFIRAKHLLEKTDL